MRMPATDRRDAARRHRLHRRHAADDRRSRSWRGSRARESARQIRIAGAVHAAYSTLTDYPLGVVKVIPYKAHLAIDALGAIAAGRHAVRHRPVPQGPAALASRTSRLAAFELQSLLLSDPRGKGDFHGDVEAVRRRPTPQPAQPDLQRRAGGGAGPGLGPPERGERGGHAVDVVLVVVEVDGEPQVAVARRAHDAAPVQLGEQPRGIGVAERHRDDGAAIGLGQVDGRPAGARPGLPAARPPARGCGGRSASAPKRSKTDSAASLPIAATQLIELSNRDAVGDSSIAGPKKLSSGTRPAFQPALMGTNRSWTAGER